MAQAIQILKLSLPLLFAAVTNFTALTPQRFTLIQIHFAAIQNSNGAIQFCVACLQNVKKSYKCVCSNTKSTVINYQQIISDANLKIRKTNYRKIITTNTKLTQYETVLIQNKNAGLQNDIAALQNNFVWHNKWFVTLIKNAEMIDFIELHCHSPPNL